MPRLALMLGSAALLAPLAVPVAVAQDPGTGDQWVRGVGRGHSLDIKTTTVYSFGGVCSPNDLCGQPIDATITMTVSGATKRKHKLPSTTIAKSEPFAARGEAQVADMVVTGAMRRKLKRVEQLAITTKFVVRGPIADTTTKKATFKVGSRDGRRFCIGTTHDPMCGPGGTTSGRG